MNTPLNTIKLPFSKLEVGTTFKSWTGMEWIKVSEDKAIAPNDKFDITYDFDIDEIVEV